MSYSPFNTLLFCFLLFGLILCQDGSTCGTPFPLTEATISVQTSTNDNSGNVDAVIACGGATRFQPFWYSIDATASYDVYVETQSTFGGDLAVVNGDCATLVCVSSATTTGTTATLTFSATPGTYYIVFSAITDGEEGSFTLNYNSICTQNSDCPDDTFSCTDPTCDINNANADTSGCFLAPNDATCNDNLECTVTDTCDPNDPSNDANGCVYEVDNTLCDDSVGCTIDECIVGVGCQSTPDDSACEDNIGCTVNTCDSVAGCLFPPNDDLCDDADACTTDECSPEISGDASGCVFTEICVDELFCTIDTCYGFVNEETEYAYCFYSAVDCDDFDACTIDSCSEELEGCIHEPIVCNDYDSSTINTCDRIRGCQFIPNICSDDDDNVCTIPILNLDTGECENGQTLDCDDRNPCTEDYCDPMRGCQITYIDCDDELICTIDYCDESSGECIHEEKDCSENPGTVCSEELFGECVEVTQSA